MDAGRDGRMEHMLDAELVELAQQGEGQAFNVLVARYQAKVMRLVYRYVNNTDVALDLVQDIFLKIFKNLVNFKGESKFSSWLFRVAVNDSIDYLRHVKVRKEQSLDHLQESGYDVAETRPEGDAAAGLEEREKRKQVRDAMAGLPENQRSVVIMKIYQEMTFEEIADVMEEPVSTIKSRLYKALNTLGGALRRQRFIERGKV